MIIIGVDPGLHGAIAVLDGGALREILDTPIFETLVGKKKRSRLDKARLLHEVGRLRRDYGAGLAVLEDVSSRPDDGAIQAFAFGRVVGALDMVFTGYGYRIEYVRPQVWKKALHVPALKSAACARADEIFPEHRAEWRGARGGLRDGRAEAAMIAKYGAQTYDR
jgi:hypothetical protein